MSLTIHKLIRESNAIEDIFGEDEVRQSLTAWDYLRVYRNLDAVAICTAQSLITKLNLEPKYRGHFRSVTQTNVSVGSYVPPAWSMVDGMMGNWLLDYKSRTPWENHVAFEKIHPFVDGNGRTGRMLMWWQEVQNGEQPTLIQADRRHSYYLALSAKNLSDSARDVLLYGLDQVFPKHEALAAQTAR